MEKIFLPQLKDYYIKWSNKKLGYFVFQELGHTPNIKLYFHEFEYWIKDNGAEGRGDTYPTHGIESWENNKEKHIIATGFIAFCLWWIQSKHKNNPIIDLFDTYFVLLRNIFIAEKKSLLEFRYTTDEEFNDMFYSQHITDENKRIEDSQSLFEYLTDYNREEIQKYMDAYFEHIEMYKSKSKTKNFNRTADIEKLKEYLIPEIFTKKGNQRSKADELINMLNIERRDIEFAEIAMFIQQNLLNDRYKYSINWMNWLSVFYKIVGVKDGYNYRQTKIVAGNLTQQLIGLFPKQKKHQ